MTRGGSCVSVKLMQRFNERGVVHLFLLLLLGAGLIAAVYLVTSGNPLKLFSKASVSKPTGPETSLTLVGPARCEGLACLLPGNPAPQEEFSVKLYARSDIEGANLFEAKMSFPKDLVEVKEIKTEGGFAENWVENFYDNDTGEISLTGGVPAPGYQTQTGGESGLMAAIVFKAKALGKGAVAFKDTSSIYSNLNNINILTVKRNYDLSVEVKPSPTPSSQYHLEQFPPIGVHMVAPGGYGVAVWLKDMQGNLVTNQQDLDYSWEIEQFNAGHDIRITPWSGCIDGINPPCPNSHADITVSSIGSTSSANLWVTVTNKQTKEILDKAEFVLNFIPRDRYVSVASIKPGSIQGEVYDVGQQVQVRWELDYGDHSVVDYYNVGYWYYKDGQYKTGYIGTIRRSEVNRYNIASLDWVIPVELAGQVVRISIEPRGSIITTPGWGHADYSFRVTSSSPTPYPTATTAPALPCKAVPKLSYSTGISCKTDFITTNPIYIDCPTDKSLIDFLNNSCSYSGPLGPCGGGKKINYYTTAQGGTQIRGDLMNNECNGPRPVEIRLHNTAVATGPKGDGNNDKKINLVDMSILHTDYRKTNNMAGFRDGIDMNNDGLINAFDFSSLRGLLVQLGVIRAR